ncbi:cellulase family glycosylhydrolase [Candidatus Dependentiae bacterium]|nr:cellulase family glycosylhydrolase [Candidatus Dependentiae bacterium]
MNKVTVVLICTIFHSISNYGSVLESTRDYWSMQRKGANFFNKVPGVDWFVKAKEFGIEFARLAPDKWHSVERDFLVGDADDFKEIPQKDYIVLKNVLDQAADSGMSIVITVLSLPGSRWKQNNGDKDDLRLWQQENYKNQAISFWKQLALLLKNHPAIVGYNLLNEPHPEIIECGGDYREVDFDGWYSSIKGSLEDLNLFYHDVIKAIREVDTDTPIILDTGMYATPWALRSITPVADENVIYSFHMYEPYIYTTARINKGRFTYPGPMPLYLKDSEESNGRALSSVVWDKGEIERFFKPVVQWQRDHKIPSSRILVGEFGCDRMAKGAEQYLSDLIDFFNRHSWHWAFYSFREDCWGGMDYQLGYSPYSAEYWDSLEKGECLDRFRKDNPLSDMLKAELKK